MGHAITKDLAIDTKMPEHGAMTDGKADPETKAKPRKRKPRPESEGAAKPSPEREGAPKPKAERKGAAKPSPERPQPPPDLLLHFLDMAAEEIEALLGIGERQQVV